MKQFNIKIKVLPKYLHLYSEAKDGYLTVISNDMQFDTAEHARRFYENLYKVNIAESVHVETEEVEMPPGVEEFIRENSNMRMWNHD